MTGSHHPVQRSSVPVRLDGAILPSEQAAAARGAVPQSDVEGTHFQETQQAPSTSTVSKAVGHVLAGLSIVVVIEFLFVIALAGAAQSGALDTWLVLNLVVGAGTLITGGVFLFIRTRRWIGLGLVLGGLLGTAFALLLYAAVASAIMQEI